MNTAEVEAQTQETTAFESQSTTASIQSQVDISSVEQTVQDASANTQQLANGTYTMACCAASGKSVDSPGGSTANGTKVQIYDTNGTDAQAWRAVTDANGYTTFYCGDSNQVLDVLSGNAYAGATVQLYAANGSKAQKWLLTIEGSGYKIVSALDPKLVLDLCGAGKVNGTKLQLWTDNGTAAQRWTFSVATTTRERIDSLASENASTISDGSYRFASALASSKVMVARDGGTDNGTAIQIYGSNGTDAQTWTVVHDSKGYVTLVNAASGKVLDVTSGSAKAETALQLYTSNGTYAQKWIAIKNSDGTISFISALNTKLVIDVKGGSSNNGTLLQLYALNGTKAQGWSFAAVETKRTRLNALAKANADALSDGTYGVRSNLYPTLVLAGKQTSQQASTVVQTYTASGASSQQWTVTHDILGYVTFVNVNTGMTLDVTGGASAAGTIVQQHGSNATWAQKWIVIADSDTFKVVSALDQNLVLDVSGASLRNSGVIQLYTSNDTAAQRWLFSKVGKSAVTVSASYGSNAIVPVDVSFGDYVLCLPSAASDGNANVGFSADVYVGGSRTHVAKDSTVTVSSILGSTLSGTNLLNVFDAAGRLLSHLYVMASQNIASIFVSSSDPAGHGRAWVESSSDHSNAASGLLTMVDADGTVVYDGKLSQIKGRGNTSWAFSKKKPYQIKLDKKTDLLETGSKDNKAKTWCLISDDMDASSARNVTSYTLAQLFGSSSAVQFRNVDLYYDGEYRGNYLLCEKVQVASGRVDIEDLEDANEEINPDIDSAKIVNGANAYGNVVRYAQGVTSPSDISGGYLIEYESDPGRYNAESAYFTVGSNGSSYTFVCKSPEVWSYDEANYMSCLVQDMFDAMNNGGVVPTWRGSSRAGMKTTDFIDFGSLARIYWVNEITKNRDGYTWSSSYIYKDSDASGNSKLIFGPAWDFDLSLGSRVSTSDTSVFDPEGYWTRANGLFTSFMNDPTTASAINACKKEIIAATRSYLNDGTFQKQMDDIQASLNMDFIVWGRNSENGDTVRNWLLKRLDWLENN